MDNIRKTWACPHIFICPEGDLNLKPNCLSILEFETWWIRPLGHHSWFLTFHYYATIFWVGLVLSKKSYPNELTTKNGRKKVIQKSYPNFFIQINTTLYQIIDTMPLYIKEKRYFTVFWPDFISMEWCYANFYKKMMLFKKSRKISEIEKLLKSQVRWVRLNLDKKVLGQLSWVTFLHDLFLWIILTCQFG